MHDLMQVIAESLSEEEIAGLKQMFEMIDEDNSGHITFDELKAGLKRVGANLKESEIYDLMQAVRPISNTFLLYFISLSLLLGVNNILNKLRQMLIIVERLIMENLLPQHCI